LHPVAPLTAPSLHTQVPWKQVVESGLAQESGTSVEQGCPTSASVCREKKKT